MLGMALKLLVLRPELLLSHMTSYGNLLVVEGSKAWEAWRIQMVLYAASAVFFCLGVFSTTISLLLWAAIPVLNQSTSWLMVAMPVLIFFASGALLFMARKYPYHRFILNIHQQIQLDMQLLGDSTSASFMSERKNTLSPEQQLSASRQDLILAIEQPLYLGIFNFLKKKFLSR